MLCGLLNLRRCGCSIIARSTSRLGLSLECSSSLPPNPAQRSWLGTPVCFRLPARSKACGGLFVRACWVCGPWWRMSGVWVLSAVWLVASRSERAHRTLFMCRLERRCSFHGCAAPVFPTPRCGIPALPQPFLSAVPSWDCRGSSKTRPWSYPSRRSCEATVACVRVLFSRVRCTRSGWGLRSPSVPQMIGFLGKMPAAVSVQSFPSRGRRQCGAQGR